MTAAREPAHGWRVGDGVVVRTPLLPASVLLDWAAAPDPRRFLRELIEDPAVDEALFVASPSLYGSIAAWRDKPDSGAGRRTEHALAKYVARMAGRPTPFGLFSGVSTGAIARQTQLTLAPRAEYRRRTRIDNDYLFVLAEQLAKVARAALVVRPNTSLYTIAGRLRYASAHVEGKERTYHLVSVEPTPYLEATLARARDGATVGALAAPLAEGEITAEEARAFVDELVEAQLLVPELGIHVTGPDPLEGMLAQLAGAGLDREVAALSRARDEVRALDGGGIGRPAEQYRAIAAILEPLPAKLELSRLFQVDMVKPASIAIDRRVATDVVDALGQLARIAPRDDGGTLATFRRSFRERWEDREIPLAEALDEESGIGFEAARVPGAEGAPLLAGLPFPAPLPSSDAQWGARERHLVKLLAAALADGRDEVVLADADFDAMATPGDPVRLPDAFAAMVRLVGDAPGAPRCLLESVGGPSGANLLGRFCHASPDVDRIVRDHIAAEEQLAPDAVFAEIVHLNEGRIGNVICRPVLRAYEIAFLGFSGAPRDRQILLDDLLVSVRGERIVLRSRRLGREIVPRLTNAHNFRLRTQGVYRFLCALAHQGVSGAGWSWGPLGGAPRLPRVRYKDVLLARAAWNLDERALTPITTAARAAAKTGERAAVLTAVAALRATHKLPRFVAVAVADNELPIDLDNPILVAAFADELAGTQGARVVEILVEPHQLAVRGPEGGFTNEAILTFTRAKPPGSVVAARRDEPKAPTLRRSFGPGSEWLYAKIYCGESSADRVLRDAIAQVVRDVHGGPWFFIRYADPDPHLRVRMRGEPARLLSTVLPALERALEPLIAGGVARRVVLDTYDREIERYGGDAGMELVEQLFWRDAECVLAIVELLEGDAGADARWRLAVRGCESLLDALGLTAEQRGRIFALGRDSLGAEMRADAAFYARIGDRFTKERASLELLFARDPARDAGHDLEPGFELLARRDAQIRELAPELRRLDDAGALAPRLEGFAWSLVHMHANRLLHASQRAQELVIYDFLRRLHAAARARGPR